MSYKDSKSIWIKIIVKYDGKNISYDLTPKGNLKTQFRAKRRNLIIDEIIEPSKSKTSVENENTSTKQEITCASELLEEIDDPTINLNIHSTNLDTIDFPSVENNELEIFDYIEFPDLLDLTVIP